MPLDVPAELSRDVDALRRGATRAGGPVVDEHSHRDPVDVERGLEDPARAPRSLGPQIVDGVELGLRREGESAEDRVVEPVDALGLEVDDRGVAEVTERVVAETRRDR